jgi:leader peptidase (prepilin peptidase) / N-methyltransferase
VAIILLAAFVCGAVLGSFLNVCIVRVPAGESIAYPASHCPRCHTPIRSRDNVPLLSYAVLRGRCRACGMPISARYPAVEALTGAAMMLLVDRFGLAPLLPVYALFVAALIVISFIDLDHQIIPDVISLPGIVIGMLLAALGYGPPILTSLTGALLGGGLLYAIALGYHALTGREGMGGGDIKLLAMIGAFLGWRGVLVTLLLSSFSGAVIGIGLMLARGADTRIPIPFGPFLALGALCALLFGDALMQWYLNLAFSA